LPAPAGDEPVVDVGITTGVNAPARRHHAHFVLACGVGARAATPSREANESIGSSLAVRYQPDSAVEAATLSTLGVGGSLQSSHIDPESSCQRMNYLENVSKFLHPFRSLCGTQFGGFFLKLRHESRN
jgi:hypothetical protein